MALDLTKPRTDLENIRVILATGKRPAPFGVLPVLDEVIRDLRDAERSIADALHTRVVDAERRAAAAPTPVKPSVVLTAPAKRTTRVTGREPALPSVAQVAEMLKRVIVLRPDAHVGPERNPKPVGYLDLAQRWLREERAHRKMLRERALYDPSAVAMLAERTPEYLCGVQTGQTFGADEGPRVLRRWEDEKARADAEAAERERKRAELMHG